MGAAHTDAEGRFALCDLPGPGRYRVHVAAPGGVSDAHVADTHDGEVVLRIALRAKETDAMREAIERMKERTGGERDPRGSER